LLQGLEAVSSSKTRKIPYRIEAKGRKIDAESTQAATRRTGDGKISEVPYLLVCDRKPFEIAPRYVLKLLQLLELVLDELLA
jgi:hypothetical protein